MRPTVAVVNLSKLNQNIQILKKHIDLNTAFMSIVKANAYGHGALKIANGALESGASCLGVSIPEEGVELRCGGIDCPILVLGSIDSTQAELVLEYDLIACLATIDMAKALNKEGQKRNKKARVHIKIDTGMGRIGLEDYDDIVELWKLLKGMDYISVEGVFTHFATADQYNGKYTYVQLNKFTSILKELSKLGIDFKCIHAANSAAILNYPPAQFNMVRGGIAMYGYAPTEERQQMEQLQPILEWHTKVVYIKTINKGDSISYGRTFIANDSRRVATLPVGYGDGYNRLLSNRGWVIIQGYKAPIIGNICMDQMMVDVTHISNVKVGEPAILIGKKGNEVITAYDLAKICGTIPYEILTNISSRVPRIYMEGTNE